MIAVSGCNNDIEFEITTTEITAIGNSYFPDRQPAIHFSGRSYEYNYALSSTPN